MNRTLRYISLSILFFITLLFSQHAESQTFANNWLVQGQQYFKIPISTTALYRVNHDVLVSSNIPTAQFTPQNIQLFRRGIQQNIKVIDNNNNNVFDTDDYFEFYGSQNDGKLDSLLYTSKEAHINPNYSLYSDTSYYFLTSSNTGPYKRITQQNFTGSPVNQPYIYDEIITTYRDTYLKGYYYNDAAINSRYGEAEGWSSGTSSSTASNANAAITKTIPINNAYTTAGQAYLEVSLAGLNNSDFSNYIEHQFQISIGKDASSLQVIGNSPTLTTNRGFVNYLYTTEINDLSVFSSNSFVVSIKDNSTFRDAIFSCAYIKIKYPQTPVETSNSKTLLTEINSGNSYNIPLVAGYTPNTYDITDLNNITSIGSTINNNALNFSINTNSQQHRIALIANPAIVPALFPVNVLPLYTSTDSTYIIISHPALMKPAKGSANPVADYANYRASAQGGQFDVITASILDIYDNFNYGETSPAAIRSFCQFMCRNANQIPDYLFIIGKGRDINYNNYRHLSPSQKTDPNYIPSWGIPASDHLFVEGLAGQPRYIPAFPIGRIASTTPDQVVAYRDKIMAMESQPFDQLWRKRAIHLSGGRDEGQIAAFRSYMATFAQTYKGPYVGGLVNAYSKTTTNSVEVFNLSKEVNAGTSMITFFGHSAPNVTDIDIGYVSSELYDYNNTNKYPIILLNGCSSGNMFGSYTFGEDWINTANKGAIAFIGNSGDGFTNSLYDYCSLWYDVNFADSTYLNRPIGNVQSEVFKRFKTLMGSSINNLVDTTIYIAQMQQSNLQGDPAFVLFKPNKPDYKTSDEQLFIRSADGRPVTAVSDSFLLGIVIQNLGLTNPAIRLPIKVVRTFPDGTSITYAPKSVPEISNIDTVYFSIPTGGVNSFGNNSLTVTLNYNNSILEINSNNNTGTINLFLQQSGVSCLYPKEFSIVSVKTISLIAQSTDLLTKAKEYYFEIDTAWTFTSSIKQTQVISATSLPTWNDINLLQGLPSNADSTVFYWRVRYKDLATGVDTLYGTSSFIYIPNSPDGWAQAQFPQFLKNHDSPSLKRDTLQRKWRFGQENLTIDVTTYGNVPPDYDYKKVRLYLNGAPYITGDFEFHGGQGILAVAFDKSNLDSYTKFGDIFSYSRYVPTYICGQNSAINRFVAGGFIGDTINNNATKNAYLQFSAYLDSIKSQDYVLLFSVGNAAYSKWSSTTKNKLISQGATKLQHLTDNDPYILLYQKNVGVIAEIVADTSIDNYLKAPLTLQKTVSIKYDQGAITSTKIGPSSSWKQLFRKVEIDNPANDQWNFDLLGYDLKNNETVIKPAFVPVNGMDLSTEIDSTKFSYIALRANLKDSDATTMTPPQLKHWIVTSNNNIPEGTIIVDNSDDKYSVTKSVFEGDKVSVTYSFKNISNKPFKNPLIIQYSIKNLNTNKTFFAYDTIKYVLEPMASFTKTYTFDTYDFPGTNNLQVFVNPQLQQEEYYTNNVWIIPINVIHVSINPVMEVTFDGAKIFDGDIVSPTPFINVTVTDFNKFKFKTDTTGIKLLLSRDSLNATPQLLTFNTPGVRFIPETSNNKYRIEYQPPAALADGKYILSVQATDASGNQSGINPYQVRFEVINKSAITNFFPYPNPFSNHTKFVFTLTGAEIPNEIKIQIMTVSGVVVREILQNEIGPVRIGNNITQYAWDGTDEYGDKLANGVYLYRVYVNSNGKSLDQRGTAADRAFKHNIGKLVILR